MLHSAPMLPTFLLSSRLGLRSQPQGQRELNVGVEDGPTAVVTPELVAELELAPQTFRFPLPDQLTLDEYYQRFAAETAVVAQLVARGVTTAAGTPPAGRPRSLMVGGDHSTSLAHLVGLLAAGIPAAGTGILMLDSHADLNLVATSPTGNLHGMWLRPLVSHFDQPLIDQLVPTKLDPRHLRYMGNLDLDPAEQTWFAEQAISHWPVARLRSGSQTDLTELATWLRGLAHLHLSIDVDGFDRTLTPATGIPCPAGLLLADVAPVLALVRQLPSWSLDLVELNPRKPGAATTIHFAQQLLRQVLTVSS